MSWTSEVGYELESGQTSVAARGTAEPLLGITHSAGDVTLIAGEDIVVGNGTTFIAAHVGEWLRPADGNKYLIKEFIDATHIRVSGTVVAEVSAGFRIYRRPKTHGIYVQVHSGTVGTQLLIGQDGQVAWHTTAATRTGLTVTNKTGNPFFLPADLSKQDLFIDVFVNAEIVEWMIIK